MTRICHGKGGAATPEGCCYVNGQPCPLRWRIDAGQVYEGPDDTSLGTVDAAVARLVNGRTRQDRAKAQLAGVVYACRAAVEVVANDATLLANRAAFDAAWDAHPAYVAQVRPHWAAIEERLGLAEGSYQCSTWTGTGRTQCCYAEDDVSNSTRRAGLTADALTIRSARAVG